MVITWTIEYVLEQQTYYIAYGVDSNALNETSYSIEGNSDISLVNQTYNITLDGLAYGTEYYAVVIAKYNLTTLVSETVSFTTRGLGKSIVQNY